jgi:hypothetical protein
MFGITEKKTDSLEIMLAAVVSAQLVGVLALVTQLFGRI